MKDLIGTLISGILACIINNARFNGMHFIAR